MKVDYRARGVECLLNTVLFEWHVDRKALVGSRFELTEFGRLVYLSSILLRPEDVPYWRGG